MRNFRIATISGIPVKINVSLLLILPVMAWLIGSGTQIEFYAGFIEGLTGVVIDAEALTDGSTSWVIGIAAAVGLFASVGVHEFGHALMARRYGIGTESITLWILGGLASLSEMPKEWDREFWIAVAGPITSLALAAVCYAGVLVIPSSAPVAVFVVGWLAVTNVILAVFNMLPAFPMDGGRVLRALIARRRSHVDATRIAARIGVGFALLFAFLGIVVTFSPLLLLLALFIYVAATGESRVVVLESLLEGVTAGDLVRADGGSVEQKTTVADLLDRMLAERRTAFPVLDDRGEAVGVVDLSDLKSVREGDREAFTVGEVMEEDVIRVESTASAFDLVTRLSNDRASVALVEEMGTVIGVVTTADLGEFLQFRQEGVGLRPKAAM